MTLGCLDPESASSKRIAHTASTPKLEKARDNVTERLAIHSYTLFEPAHHLVQQQTEIKKTCQQQR